MTVKRLGCDALASAHVKPDCLSDDGVMSGPTLEGLGAMGLTLANATVPRMSREVHQR